MMILLRAGWSSRRNHAIDVSSREQLEPAIATSNFGRYPSLNFPSMRQSRHATARRCGCGKCSNQFVTKGPRLV